MKELFIFLQNSTQASLKATEEALTAAKSELHDLEERLALKDAAIDEQKQAIDNYKDQYVENNNASKNFVIDDTIHRESEREEQVDSLQREIAHLEANEKKLKDEVRAQQKNQKELQAKLKSSSSSLNKLIQEKKAVRTACIAFTGSGVRLIEITNADGCSDARRSRRTTFA